jgi:hypothetical protein
MTNRKPTGLYDVGYAKPPTDSQFKKGVSGNPRGRPQGSRNLATRVKQIFGRKITVQENGRTRRITLADALLTKIASKALGGDTSAQRLAVALLQLEPADAAPLAAAFDSESDRATLRQFLEEEAASVEDAPVQKPLKPTKKGARHGKA